MISSFGAVNNLFSHIAIISEFKSGLTKISGGIYKYQRPMNSDKEDIVINSLPMNNEDIQEGILNVNIYVPNLSIDQNGVIDNSMPDTARLKTLCEIAIQNLKEVWAEDGEYNFELQQENLYQDDNNQHYINLRVMFRNVNI